MSFNPNLPAPNSPILSAELRDQFNGLKALIDLILPVGCLVGYLKSLPDELKTFWYFSFSVCNQGKIQCGQCFALKISEGF